MAITLDGTTGITASGNVTGGNLITAGAVTTATVTASGAISSSTTIAATGNITGGNLSVSSGIVSLGSITKNGSNGVGNIGSSSSYFNTVFAKATSAQYADLAEMYAADGIIEPGTVVCFGGSAEVTTCTHEKDPRVAGVVSTNPSYLMNAAIDAKFATPVALVGRVPCKVSGPVNKGDLMVSDGKGGAKADANPITGTVIGKAVADFDGESGVIEVVVGRY